MNKSPMLKHAVESFEHGLEHYLDGSDKSKKFAILHVDQSIELFLKEKIVQLGKTIYKSDGTTLNLHESFQSLKDLKIYEQPRIEELHDLRNAIQHKGLIPDNDSTQFYIGIAYNFVKRFLPEELKIPFEEILSPKHKAVMEGIPLEKSDEIIAMFDNVLKSNASPSGKIMEGYTILTRVVNLTSDQTIGKVGFRRTLRKNARNCKVDLSEFKEYLDFVMKVRNQVVHSSHEPTKEEADIFLHMVGKILKKIKFIK
ncbi:MAG: hypothetical protein PHV55_06870 [Candidatus Omnitrophica bacterium]|nr:hypothetical protein [Candidatus Omnitrophota bacterium]